MMDWYRRLIRLRRSSISLNDGEPDHVSVEFDEEKRWLMMERGQVRVMWNLGGEAVTFENAAGGRLVLASRDGIAVVGEGVVVPGDGLAIVSGEKEETLCAKSRRRLS
jgi:maltooligosyltrehalose trehalohydrolase